MVNLLQWQYSVDKNKQVSNRDRKRVRLSPEYTCREEIVILKVVAKPFKSKLNEQNPNIEVPIIDESISGNHCCYRRK